MNRIDKITEVLKDKPELQSKFVYRKTYEEVLEILLLRETCDPKFKHLFTANIWKTHPKNIELILSLPEWNDSKYQHLLTPSIWNRNYSEVKSTLTMKEWNDPRYEHLFTPSIWQCSYKDIKTILKMKEFEDPKFKHLLTSSIWANRPEQISSKLKMPYFEMPEYRHLLTPSIFLITEENINDNILLFREYGLDKHIMPTNIRTNAEDQRLLIEYMVENNIPFVIRGKLHEILRKTTTKELKKYNIDLNSLRKNSKDKKVLKRGNVSNE